MRQQQYLTFRVNEKVPRWIQRDYLHKCSRGKFKGSAKGSGIHTGEDVRIVAEGGLSTPPLQPVCPFPWLWATALTRDIMWGSCQRRPALELKSKSKRKSFLFWGLSHKHQRAELLAAMLSLFPTHFLHFPHKLYSELIVCSSSFGQINMNYLQEDVNPSFQSYSKQIYHLEFRCQL